MLLSHKYKFIFIKTVKTAGTSIEISLSRYCGKKDVITRIAKADEAIRSELNVRPQNHRRTIGRLRRMLDPRVWNHAPSERLFWNHMTAEQIRARVSPRVWNSYFKFCFDRNPWDKTLSMYYFKQSEYRDLDDFLENGDFQQYNYPRYMIDDELAVDFVGRFENLTEDLQQICKRIGLPWDGWMPRAKGKFRSDKRHYSEQLSPAQRDLIADRFRKEIDLLGYSFEEAASPQGQDQKSSTTR
jgi:hypothetical protein